jgi:hypothetical protein
MTGVELKDTAQITNSVIFRFGSGVDEENPILCAWSIFSTITNSISGLNESHLGYGLNLSCFVVLLTSYYETSSKNKFTIFMVLGALLPETKVRE